MNAVWLSKLKGTPVRSRVTRSQAACRTGAAAQWTWRPQGPVLTLHCVQTKPSAVSGVLSACFAQSESRTPEQSKMELLAVPFTPTYAEYIFLKGRRVLADQMEYLLAHFPRTSPLHDRIQRWLT